jgi:glycosyltransferase involved in cell wall biosynthesis
MLGNTASRCCRWLGRKAETSLAARVGFFCADRIYVIARDPKRQLGGNPLTRLFRVPGRDLRGLLSAACRWLGRKAETSPAARMGFFCADRLYVIACDPRGQFGGNPLTRLARVPWRDVRGVLSAACRRLGNKAKCSHTARYAFAATDAAYRGCCRLGEGFRREGTLYPARAFWRGARSGLIAASRGAFGLGNACGYAFWKRAGRRPARVRSVLHVSIISHKPYMLSRVARRNGLHSKFLALNADIGRLNAGYDYNIPSSLTPIQRKFLEFCYLWMVFARFDVIHYHFSAVVSGDGWELEHLRRLGKVLVFHYRGCDLRQRGVNMAVNPELNCCQECDYPAGSCDMDYQRFRLGLGRRYGDLFLVTTPDLRDFLPEAVHMPFIAPQGVNFGGIVPAPRREGVFRVVTSSNHPGLDGVRFVREAVARLQAEGEGVELVELCRRPYAEALSVYKSADVYAGKLTMGYYNNANIECMLMGVPCMTYIRPQYLEAIPDCPIIITRPDTVYANLKKYLHRREELAEIGARGPEYVRRRHDPDAIMGRIKALYEDALERKRAEA